MINREYQKGSFYIFTFLALINPVLGWSEELSLSEKYFTIQESSTQTVTIPNPQNTFQLSGRYPGNPYQQDDDFGYDEEDVVDPNANIPPDPDQNSGETSEEISTPGGDPNSQTPAAVAASTVVASGIKLQGPTSFYLLKQNQTATDFKNKAWNVFPEVGVKNVQELDLWKGVSGKFFRTTFKNTLGMTIANFTYNVRFVYGGSQGGKGMFIANATVLPVEAKTSIGFASDIQVRITEVKNEGTEQEPVVLLVLELSFKVTSSTKTVESKKLFELKSNGELLTIN